MDDSRRRGSTGLVARLPRVGQVWRANRVLSAATSAQVKELRANRLGQLAEASSDKRKTSETVSDVFKILKWL